MLYKYEFAYNWPYKTTYKQCKIYVYIHGMSSVYALVGATSESNGIKRIQHCMMVFSYT